MLTHLGLQGPASTFSMLTAQRRCIESERDPKNGVRNTNSIHGNPSLKDQVCNSTAGSSSPKLRSWGKGVGCSHILALTQDAGCGMLGSGSWVWDAGFRFWVQDLGCRVECEATRSQELGY